jgi:hypothetical protein
MAVLVVSSLGYISSVRAQNNSPDFVLSTDISKGPYYENNKIIILYKFEPKINTTIFGSEAKIFIDGKQYGNTTFSNDLAGNLTLPNLSIGKHNIEIRAGVDFINLIDYCPTLENFHPVTFSIFVNPSISTIIIFITIIASLVAIILLSFIIYRKSKIKKIT